MCKIAFLVLLLHQQQPFSKFECHPTRSSFPIFADLIVLAD